MSCSRFKIFAASVTVTVASTAMAVATASVTVSMSSRKSMQLSTHSGEKNMTVSTSCARGLISLLQTGSFAQ